MKRSLIKKKIDVFLLIVFPILATALTESYKLNFLIATLLFFGLPSLYLSLRNPELVKKTLLFTIIFFIPMTFIFDHPAYLDDTWFVPNSAFRFLGDSIPIEDVVWAFLWVYFAIIFWEHFLDLAGTKDRFSKNLRYLIIFLTTLLAGFFLFYFLRPEILYEPFFYLKVGAAFIIVPLGAVLLKFPRLIRKVLIIGIYFFIVSFLVEYVGLRGYHWYFAGKNYFGTVSLSGHRLPYEEIFFWWMLGAPGIIAWYELFADDRK